MILAQAALAIALIAWPGSQAGAEHSSADPGAPVLLHFHAEWCGPCKQMGPIVRQLQGRGYPIRSIDIDEHHDIAKRYGVTQIPAFLVVDARGRVLPDSSGEPARSLGAQPARELALLYNDAVHALADSSAAESVEVSPADLRSQAPSRRLAAAEADSETDPDAPDAIAAARTRAPLPWETAVRIKVGDRTRGGPIGFGSGTIIRSTPDETVILTCAHIFHVEGVRKQPLPREFRIPIEVDLFDGRLHGPEARPYLHPVESVAGEAIDYDFKSDVGLIRIRPGRVLAFSPVVPSTWKPTPGQKMTTVGCSEGQNASPWSTRITNPAFRGMIDGRDYSAIECEFAPKQGRSGGGLYTLEGYVAGVCNFAEPQGGHGLYALPGSIHRLLDRNRLAMCYNPASNAAGSDGAMLAARSRSNAAAGIRRSSGATTVRAQNSEIAAARVPMPGPQQMGVELPPVDGSETQTADATRSANRPASTAGSWRAPAGLAVHRVSPGEAIAAIDEAEAEARDADDSFVEPAQTPRSSGRSMTVLTPIDPDSEPADRPDR
jgi:thiol-disulfide isomerase/thioredoxin